MQVFVNDGADPGENSVRAEHHAVLAGAVHHYEIIVEGGLPEIDGTHLLLESNICLVNVFSAR